MKMYAYKVMTTNDATRSPVGRVFLAQEWLGRSFISNGYDRESISFNERFTARYLGLVTARTDNGKIRQLITLPGTRHLRESFNSFLKLHDTKRRKTL